MIEYKNDSIKANQEVPNVVKGGEKENKNLVVFWHEKANSHAVRASAFQRLELQCIFGNLIRNP